MSSVTPSLSAALPVVRRPFSLNRYFSTVGVIGFGVVIALMIALSDQAATRALVRQENDHNIALARSLINTLWPQYAALAARAPSLSPAELIVQPENARLRQDISRLTRMLNVVKIRIYALDGQTLYSTRDGEIGVSRAGDAPVEIARGGLIHSELAHKPRVEGLDGRVRDRYVVETYLPIDHPDSLAREGMLEIQTDVSDVVGISRNERIIVAVVLALCMLALYVFMMLAVRRAERIMSEQQRALTDSEQRSRVLARVVEQSRDSIVTRDLDGVITTWNNGAETIFGYSAQEAVGHSIRELTMRDAGEEEWQAWLARLRAGNTLSIRGWRLAKGDRRVHIVGTSGPLTDEAGRLIGDIAVTHDTTWLERSQEELRRAKDAAETAARAKSEFLANMSHEIRTPMNGIIGMTNLALDTALNAEQRDYLTTVKTSADALLEIINDILDLSKIEAGKLQVETIPFSLRDSLQQTVRVLAVRAHEKRLELIWSVDAMVPDALIGDPLRIRQIMLNLVGNAIKFTAEGEVEIQVQLEDVRDREVQLRFRVRDSGIGIAPDKLEAIFNAFEQADASTTRQFGGTGLGLSICRRLVKMLGGDIIVHSTPGAGSTFAFSVCLGLQSARQHVASDADASPADAYWRQPVLVVDDNARCRELLRAYVSSWGMLPTICDSATAAAAQLATARAAGKPFRLALIDGTLPDADAFTLATGAMAEATTVIVLAHTTQGAAIARAREHCSLHVLVKPVSQSTLYDSIAVALDPALAQAGQQTADATARSTPSAGTLDVLLVEDNAVNRKLASRLLEKMGHRVSEAHDGAVAVTMSAEHAYDVILMDMQMPVMDGLEATRAIRTREGAREDAGRRVPIIALTANAMSSDRARCLEAGMDDYISKPIEVTALVTALAQVSGAAAACTQPPAEPDAVSSPAVTAAPADAGYNRKEALERACDDEELLAQIIDIYMEETPPLLAELAALLAGGDCDRAFRAAHTIKGSSANLSANGVVNAARAVELAARAGDLANARAALPALQSTAAALFVALAATQPAAAGQTLCGALA